MRSVSRARAPVARHAAHTRAPHRDRLLGSLLRRGVAKTVDRQCTRLCVLRVRSGGGARRLGANMAAPSVSSHALEVTDRCGKARHTTRTNARAQPRICAHALPVLHRASAAAAAHDREPACRQPHIARAQHNTHRVIGQAQQQQAREQHHGRRSMRQQAARRGRRRGALCCVEQHASCRRAHPKNGRRALLALLSRR